MSNLSCDHKKTKKKLTVWASDYRGKHSQGFSWQECCVRCGQVMADIPRAATGESMFRPVAEKLGV